MAFDRLTEVTTPAAHIGFGLAAVGRPAYLTTGRAEDLPAGRGVEEMRARTHELLDAAYAQGVRYFDAARSYGRAEEFLADWLKQHPDARDAVVGSKWGYAYVGDWRADAEVHEVKDHGVDAFDRQREESAELLGDRLDLYQIHSLTPDSPALTDTDLHRRLAALAANGVTVGFSTSGPEQAAAVRAALEVTVEGERLFDTVQSTYNVLEPAVGEALAEAHDAGLTVIVKECLANGRLAGADAPAELRAVAAECGAEPDAVALAAVLRQPWAGVVLSGAATAAQLHSNLAAAAVDLDPAQYDRLAALAEPAADYWQRRAATPWS